MLSIFCLDPIRFEEAERLYKESHRIFEAALGKDHPKRASALHDLAYVYSRIWSLLGIYSFLFLRPWHGNRKFDEEMRESTPKRRRSTRRR